MMQYLFFLLQQKLGATFTQVISDAMSDLEHSIFAKLKCYISERLVIYQPDTYQS